MDTASISELGEEIFALLRSSPDGISEYELIRTLRERGHPLFPRLELDDQLALFRQHFLLFHLLYRLRLLLREEQSGDLDISTLAIRMQPYARGGEGLSVGDPLQEYYLDLSQLEQTSAEDVRELLDGFWSAVGVGPEKAGALDTLGLVEPVDYATIKHRYRQLAMQHHPDRGGDHETLQRLNEAMSILDRCYSR